MFSLTLQIGIDLLEVFSEAKKVFQHRLQSTDIGLEEKFGKDVQRAYQHWLDFIPVEDDVLFEIKQQWENKHWENKFDFNIFILIYIYQPRNLNSSQVLDNFY